MEIRNFNYSLDIQSASFFSFLKSLLENSRTKFNPIIPIILSFQRFLKILQNIISLSIVEEFKKIKGFFFSVCFRIDPPQRHLIYNPYTIHREKNKSSSYKTYFHTLRRKFVSFQNKSISWNNTSKFSPYFFTQIHSPSISKFNSLQNIPVKKTFHPLEGN